FLITGTRLMRFAKPSIKRRNAKSCSACASMRPSTPAFRHCLKLDTPSQKFVKSVGTRCARSRTTHTLTNSARSKSGRRLNTAKGQTEVASIVQQLYSRNRRNVAQIGILGSPWVTKAKMQNASESRQIL